MKKILLVQDDMRRWPLKMLLLLPLLLGEYTVNCIHKCWTELFETVALIYECTFQEINMKPFSCPLSRKFTLCRLVRKTCISLTSTGSFRTPREWHHVFWSTPFGTLCEWRHAFWSRPFGTLHEWHHVFFIKAFLDPLWVMWRFLSRTEWPFLDTFQKCL